MWKIISADSHCCFTKQTMTTTRTLDSWTKLWRKKTVSVRNSIQLLSLFTEGSELWVFLEPSWAEVKLQTELTWAKLQLSVSGSGQEMYQYFFLFYIIWNRIFLDCYLFWRIGLHVELGSGKLWWTFFCIFWHLIDD